MSVELLTHASYHRLCLLCFARQHPLRYLISSVSRAYLISLTVHLQITSASALLPLALQYLG